MARTRLAGTRSPAGVPSAAVQSRVQARGDVFGEICGTTRWLAEYVNGTLETASFGVQEQVAPPTPLHGDTRPGHDHSGGMMGVPLKMTVWSHCYGWHDNDTLDYNNAPRSIEGGKIIEAQVGPIWVPHGHVYARGLKGCAVVKVDTGPVDVVVTFTTNDGSKSEGIATLAAGDTYVIETTRLIRLPTGRFSSLVAKVDVTDWSVANTTVRLIYLGLNQIFDTPIPTVTAP